MIINKSIVPWILIKVRGGLGFVNEHCSLNEHHSEYRFYILTEIKTIDGYDHEYDMLIFYGLTEEQFFRRERWFVEKSIDDGTADIVA